MKISHKLAQFAATVSRGASRPLYKFLRDMLAGMCAKKSILSFGETPEFFYYRLAEAVAMILLLSRASP